MSRQCPARHHLFLNWLRTNRTRFSVQPRITRIRNRQLTGNFQGITPALTLQIYRGLINLDVIWNNRNWGAAATFMVVEQRHAHSLYSNMLDTGPLPVCLPLDGLYIRDCFEELLAWCNQQLASKSWIALYRYSSSDLTLPRLQHSPKQEESPEQMMLITALPLTDQPD